MIMISLLYLIRDIFYFIVKLSSSYITLYSLRDFMWAIIPEYDMQLYNNYTIIRYRAVLHKRTD